MQILKIDNSALTTDPKWASGTIYSSRPMASNALTCVIYLPIGQVTIPEGFIMKMLLLAITITFGSFVSFAVLACGSSDSTTHVGPLMSVNKDAGQFTILDMMLGTPLSFDADAKILLNLEGVKGTIQVDFEGEGDQLKAIEVRY
jgi:hypothetical protein